MAALSDGVDVGALTTYAKRAEEENAKLNAGVERLRTFKGLLDTMHQAAPQG